MTRSTPRFIPRLLSPAWERADTQLQGYTRLSLPPASLFHSLPSSPRRGSFTRVCKRGHLKAARCFTRECVSEIVHSSRAAFERSFRSNELSGGSFKERERERERETPMKHAEASAKMIEMKMNENDRMPSPVLLFSSSSACFGLSSESRSDLVLYSFAAYRVSGPRMGCDDGLS